MPFGFEPNFDQAVALDRRVRLSLAESLDHIVRQCQGRLPYDVDRLQPLLADARSPARFPCSTFALYTQLVLALTGGDHEQAVRLLGLLELERPLGPEWRILPLDASEHQPHRDRLLRFMGVEDPAGFLMVPPAEATALAFADRLRRGRTLLRRALPALAAEIDTLVTDVILVAGDEHAAYQFDGGSCYMLWGGLFLNATSHETEVAVVEVLAHETAHMLLYACSAEEALVENADDELYSSPLRRDPRPMDGIYHATFVSARMHWAMSRLCASGLLAGDELEAAARAREQDLRNFWTGYGVVERHGRLTPTGAQVMGAALQYMQTQGRVVA